MIPLEKILSDILNKMDDDDMVVSEKPLNNNCVYDSKNKFNKINQSKEILEIENEENIDYANNKNNTNSIFYNNIINKNKPSSLDLIVKEAILQWLNNEHGQKVLKECLSDAINQKLDVPISYITTVLNEKLSDEAILKIFKKILKENL
jgi:hypothetical protein